METGPTAEPWMAENALGYARFDCPQSKHHPFWIYRPSLGRTSFQGCPYCARDGKAELRKRIKELEAELEAQRGRSYEEARALAERAMENCDECDEQRWIWYTCGEGTCEMSEQCPTCNADAKLPMNWDKRLTDSAD